MKHIRRVNRGTAFLRVNDWIKTPGGSLVEGEPVDFLRHKAIRHPFDADQDRLYSAEPASEGLYLKFIDGQSVLLAYEPLADVLREYFASRYPAPKLWFEKDYGCFTLVPFVIGLCLVSPFSRRTREVLARRRQEIDPFELVAALMSVRTVRFLEASGHDLEEILGTLLERRLLEGWQAQTMIESALLWTKLRDGPELLSRKMGDINGRLR